MDIVPRPFSFCKGKRHCVKHPPLQQNPPELENLPHAGPRGNHPAARGRGGSESRSPFLYSPLFAFFMCPVSHTFPAYNGNEMPPWYTIIFFVYGRVVYKPRCLLLCFLCGTFRQFARAHERLSPQCRGTPRVKPSGKSRLFLTGGQSLFYGLRFSAETLFFVRGFAGLRGRGRGLSLWWCSILAQGGKAASPASASPWRTPANRCRTRLFSAPNSPAFRGSQQPLRFFSLEEPSADQEPLALLSTSRSSTLPRSKYQANHPVP